MEIQDSVIFPKKPNILIKQRSLALRSISRPRLNCNNKLLGYHVAHVFVRLISFSIAQLKSALIPFLFLLYTLSRGYSDCQAQLLAWKVGLDSFVYDFLTAN